MTQQKKEKRETFKLKRLKSRPQQFVHFVEKTKIYDLLFIVSMIICLLYHPTTNGKINKETAKLEKNDKLEKLRIATILCVTFFIFPKCVEFLQ